jgi:CheY-like chemotaxis protein
MEALVQRIGVGRKALMRMFWGGNMEPIKRLFKILIAEDNAADVFIIQYALKEHGVEAQFVVIGDGEEAFDYMNCLSRNPDSESIDLVLLDLHLPKRDGAELIAHFRSLSPISHIPLIALSSSVSPQEQRLAEERGALHYFQKPASLDEFIELGDIVKRILHSKSPEIELRG